MNTSTFASEFGQVTILNEPTYTFGSTDNTRRYAFEKNLQPGEPLSSVHGVLLNDEPLAVFGASGGCTGVHKRSALILSSELYLAVGDRVVCFALDNISLHWSAVVDSATCFGIHYEKQRDALISHGELEISRITTDGKVLWSTSGADIFSEGFDLGIDFIEVVDFNGREYHISYETGEHL